tara:strand:- start:33 stop:848 length:816 start_codon:yes stop_codon:yes gene_type:complete
MSIFAGPNIRFTSKFYVIHLVLCCSYLILRCFLWTEQQLAWLHQPTGFLGIALFPRELEIFLLLLVVLLSRYRKSPTIDHFLVSVVLFSKVYIITMLWNVDRQLMGWFLTVVFALFVLLKTPQYNGPTKVSVVDKGALEDVISDLRNHSKTSSGGTKSVLLEITAGWNDGSRSYGPTFAELSLRFSSDELRFLTVDVARWPTVATEYNINTSAYNSTQLPSYILFEQGKEIKRLPPMDKKTNLPVETSIRKEGIIQYFDLAKRLLDARKRD